MAIAVETPTMFPVPTVAPRAVAVAEKAFLHGGEIAGEANENIHAGKAEG